MPVFYGEFEHALDVKGRLILPVKLRDHFAAGGFLTKVLDGCLALYTDEEFTKVLNTMQERARRGQMERNVVRSFAAGSTDVSPDRQGRIAIPANLRAFAGLEREVTVTGQINRVEIWDAARWAEVNRRGEEMLAGAQPGLDDLGI
ncbi:MAG: division/cell wall cluster transcriptional repressor MraZ [Acidimicrobiales bacterium]